MTNKTKLITSPEHATLDPIIIITSTHNYSSVSFPPVLSHFVQTRSH